MLLDGGEVNSARLQAGLVDELSLVIAPSVDGMPGGLTVFDIHGGPGVLGVMSVGLESCQVLEGNFVWLRDHSSWDTGLTLICAW